jgi:hypothetical protein
MEEKDYHNEQSLRLHLKCLAEREFEGEPDNEETRQKIIKRFNELLTEELDEAMEGEGNE